MNNYFEFVGVQSCEEVFTLYILIWTLTGLNLVAFFTGILTAAMLGNIKYLVSYSIHCQLHMRPVELSSEKLNLPHLVIEGSNLGLRS